MTILSLSFYILVGLLVFLIILALIWTRVIRPDTTEDKINKLTSYPLAKLKKIIKKLGKSNKNVFYNLVIEDEKRKRTKIYIPGVIVTNEKIYLLASPIYSDKRVKFSGEKYLFEEFKKDVDLKYDAWFNRTTLYLSKKLGVSQETFQLVIPTMKKTKKLKRMILMSDIIDNHLFKNNSEISDVIYNKILDLNIVNIKKQRRMG